MNEFFETLRTIPVIRYALLAGIVASVTFGAVGTFVVTRRISYIAAAISHAMLGGIGAAVYYSRTYDIGWLTPTLGAIVAAILSALIIGWISLSGFEREDTIIGAIWAAGMASGLLFLHYSPGTAVYLESYIFGNILLTSFEDVIATLILGAVVVLTILFNYHKLVAVCFDPEFASLRGVHARAYYILLLVLTALAMVLVVRVAGIILSLALLILPAATVSRFVSRMWLIIVGAVLLSVAYNAGGLALSFQLDIPTGPFVVILACLGYGIAIGAKYLLKKIPRGQP
ncbi:MAG: metal ABC transporter permease [Verrucomicrobiota bacterium]